MDWLWFVLGSFSWLWVVLGGCGQFWLILGGCGRLVVILTIAFSVARFWVALGICD